MIRLETDRLMSDDKTMYYLPELKQNDIDVARENFDEVLKDRDSENRELYFLCMESKESHEIIGNVGSERVMQKNGMVKYAELKDHEVHDGKLKTRVEYRLLKDEWEAL